MASLFRNAVAMCPPNFFKVAYKINPWMGGTVDTQLAHKQWNSLKTAIEKCGVTVKTIEPDSSVPDMVFCCNSGLVYHNKVYLAHFRYPERQAERKFYEAWYRKNGFEVFGDTEYYFEAGGDCTFTNKDTLFAGYGFRSQKEVYDKIQKLGDFKIVRCELVYDKYYHMDTCFCYLGSNLALWYPKAFSEDSQQRMKKEIDLIEVTEKDAERFVCNSIAFGKTVIVPKGCDDIKPVLEKRGYEVVYVDLSEFLKGGGACQCLVLKI